MMMGVWVNEEIYQKLLKRYHRSHSHILSVTPDQAKTYQIYYDKFHSLNKKQQYLILCKANKDFIPRSIAYNHATSGYTRYEYAQEPAPTFADSLIRIMGNGVAIE